MKLSIFILFFTVYNSIDVLAQFRITEEATDKYSGDPFTNEIYYTEFYTGAENKITLPDLIVTDSPFPGLPHFSQKHHQAVYLFESKVFLYDFDEDTTIILHEFTSEDFNLNTSKDFNPTGLLFSPNNINLLIGNSIYYSFTDSSIHSLGTNMDGSRKEVWSSDSTILFQFDENVIKININTLNIDTLLTNNTFISFDYDSTSQMIAYSVLFDTLFQVNQQLRLYNLSTQKDSLLFSINDTYCAGAPVVITWIQWNKDANKIAFLIYDGTAPLTGIYFYDLDSSKAFEITECNHYPLKEMLSWYNKDTLLYLHFDYEYWNAYQLYGIPVRKITSVRDDVINTNDFYLYGNYPNPFNSDTIIKFELNKRQRVELKLYNILGQEVLSEYLGELEKGLNEYKLILKDKNSGIFIYNLISQSGSISGKIVLLK